MLSICSVESCVQADSFFCRPHVLRSHWSIMSFLSTAQNLYSRNLPGMMPLLEMQILTPVMWSPGRGSRSASTSSTSPSWTTRMPSSPSQPWRWEHMTSIIQAPYKNNKRDSYNDLMLQFNDMIWLPLSGAPGLPGLPALLHRAHRRKQWQGKKALSDSVTCYVRKQNDKMSHQIRCQCPSLTNSNMSWV